MANRIASAIPISGNGAMHTGAGVLHLVQTPSGSLYAIALGASGLLHFSKSSDNGVTWSPAIAIAALAVTNLAVWYDRWSNIAAGLIHIAYTGSAADDTFYGTIDTESSDALSTQTVIFAGASTASGGHLSITRAVGGNVYCKTVIDAGAEGGFYRLPNANVPSGAWDAARTVDEAIATTDQMILQPDFDAADNQDIMAFFWDASANEISRKLYDDSADTWAETSISTGMVDNSASNGFPHFAAAPDISGTQSVLVAWNGIDTANADLKCWTVDSGTITACTDVVTNGTDDQGLAAISIDTATGYWHVFYFGKSDGSETWGTSGNIYTKVSMDSGTTWGPETVVTTAPYRIDCLFTTPRVDGSKYQSPVVAYTVNLAAGYQLYVSTRLPSRRASHQLYGG